MSIIEVVGKAFYAVTYAKKDIDKGNDPTKMIEAARYYIAQAKAMPGAAHLAKEFQSIEDKLNLIA